MADEEVEELDAEEEEGTPRQTISRMPPEATVGPFFPSGMSAPEAAMSGATGDMSDEEKEKVEAMKADYGLSTEEVDAEDDGE